MHEMRFDNATGHAASFYKSSLAKIYGYDRANDGPECEVITRILASHPRYVPGIEKRALRLARIISGGRVAK